MIKALQKKLIVAAMIAITVLLLVLLGMINTVKDVYKRQVQTQL